MTVPLIKKTMFESWSNSTELNKCYKFHNLQPAVFQNNRKWTNTNSREVKDVEHTEVNRELADSKNDALVPEATQISIIFCNENYKSVDLYLKGNKRSNMLS